MKIGDFVGKVSNFQQKLRDFWDKIADLWQKISENGRLMNRRTVRNFAAPPTSKMLGSRFVDNLKKSVLKRIYRAVLPKAAHYYFELTNEICTS
jgi:hypothetical protein